jgi:proliferating cell nuclear antigen
MPRILISEIGLLRESLDSISTLISEGSFRLGKEGIKLIAMDPTSVAMVIFHLLPKAFESLEFEKEISIKLSLAQLVAILKRARSKEKLEIELEDERRLRIRLIGDTKRTFLLPLIAGEGEEQREPALKFEVEVELEASILREAIRDASMISDSVTFEAGEGRFLITARGDSSETMTEFSKESPALLRIEIKGEIPIRAKYSVEYLERMLRFARLAESLKVSFSKDYPLRLDYRMLEKLNLSFILAPRVDTS